MQHNNNLRRITPVFERPLLEEQYQLLSNAIGNIIGSVNLDLKGCIFGNDQSFNRIVTSCTGVKSLKVNCHTHENYAAVAALLQDPRAKLESLKIEWERLHGEGFTLMRPSLIGNTTMKYLTIGRFDDAEGQFPTILCNASSIESICNSNHTLEDVRIRNEIDIRNPWIKLNRNPDKNKVIRQKIVQYYFRADFDIGQIVKMPLSALPRVFVTVRESDANGRSAIFRLLQCIPELCNVSSRDPVRNGTIPPLSNVKKSSSDHSIIKTTRQIMTYPSSISGTLY